MALVMSTHTPLTFQAAIDRFPTVSAFAVAMGVPYQRAYKWYLRDSVPPAYWPQLIAALAVKDCPITVDDIFAMQAAPRVAA